MSSAEMPAASLVLIAEDKETYRNELVRQLRSKGYRTLIAKDGEQALDMMLNFGKMVNAIVTDYRMCEDGKYNADYLLREMEKEKIPMRPTVLFTAEPGQALTSMYDILGIKDRSEYTDSSPPNAESRRMVDADIAILKKHRFHNPQNGLTLHVVPKTMVLWML